MKKSSSKDLSIEMSFYIHATEDEQKLLDGIKAIFNLPPENFRQSIFEGHYGNPIVKYTSYLKGSLAKHVLEAIFTRLDPVDKRLLLESLRARIDEHKNLYLRIDKSSLFKNFLKLGAANVIHFKIIPRNKSFKNVEDLYKNLVMEVER